MVSSIETYKTPANFALLAFHFNVWLVGDTPIYKCVIKAVEHNSHEKK